MGKSLNIKDPEIWDMASAVARMEGVSMTRAVHAALAARLEAHMAGLDGAWADWIETMGALTPMPELWPDRVIEADTAVWPVRDW